MAQPATISVGRASSVASGALTRWMWVWIATGVLVVLVVIGFLLGIVSSLRSIDTALAEADRAVTGAGGDVVPLPAHVANVNGTLGDIDTSLKPIPGQADQIIAALSSVTGNLGKVDGSLKDTSGSLVDTSGSLKDTSGSLIGTSGSLVETSGVLVNVSGSLVDTSNILVTVRGQAGDITNTLKAAQSPPDKLGTENIWQRVQTANGVLHPAKADTANILSGLVDVNKHLTSICGRLPQSGQC